MQLAELNALGGLRHLLFTYKAPFPALVALNDVELTQFFRGELELEPCSMGRVQQMRAYGLGMPSKICLVCLRKGMATPHYFNYALSVACPTHDVELLDACPFCDAPIAYTRRLRHQCINCLNIFLDHEPKAARNWMTNFKQRFSPSADLGFCAVRSHSDMAIARILVWHNRPGRSRPKDKFPYVGLRHYAWLEQVANMTDSDLAHLATDFVEKHPRYINDLTEWTRYETPANIVIQKALNLL
ncbi:hypothetical protein GTP41_20870 [Pseudoduganella sp. DS3]|uniref:TniQ family protein n=1 Tax=Pseudoduganella guangdongensis TaxID=2692179 RepID=A0A6N9HME1_9BURK|nr:hypothetical protein [Pseudoduganella guangdongensis]MYN04549.1 hypothetical protein [Pseudoduganella guangdongensis]